MFIFTAVFISLFFLYGSNSQDKQSFYGIYTFDEVIYLWGFSSSTIELTNKDRAGDKYIIKPHLFKVVHTNKHLKTFEIKSPKYVKEENKCE